MSLAPRCRHRSHFTVLVVCNDSWSEVRKRNRLQLCTQQPSYYRMYTALCPLCLSVCFRPRSKTVNLMNYLHHFYAVQKTSGVMIGFMGQNGVNFWFTMVNKIHHLLFMKYRRELDSGMTLTNVLFFITALLLIHAARIIQI